MSPQRLPRLHWELRSYPSPAAHPAPLLRPPPARSATLHYTMMSYATEPQHDATEIQLKVDACVSVGGGESPGSGQGSGGEAGDAADEALGG